MTARLSGSNLGPRTVSGIRNEVVAVRWGAIRVSVTGCAFWRIVSWIPRYEGTLIGAVVLLAVWVAAFVWIGDSWWQLASATVLAVAMTQIAFLGHDAAHRQIFKSGRWNDWVSLIIANLLVGISYGWWQSKHPPPREPQQRGRRPRHRPTGCCDDSGDGHPAPEPAAAVAGRSPGLVLLPATPARGPVSAHRRPQTSPQPRQGRAPVGRDRLPDHPPRRVGRLGARGAAAGQAVAFLAVQLAVFGLYMGSSFAPNHIGMPLVSPKLKLDFLRRQVLMSRNITGGPLISIFMGGLNYQVEHHLFPSMARPHLRKIQSLVATYCADEGVPYTQTSLWQSYRTVIGYLNTVGLKGKDPFLCPLVAQRRVL